MGKLFAVGFLTGILLFLAVIPAGASSPNLVVILADDLGYADVGFNGCTDIPTPHIDRIAAEGIRCTNAYVTHSVCGPSRAALITGRYQCRFGACRNPTVDPSVPNNGVPRSEQNLAELLKPRGYRSMVVGKWHLGTYPDLHPLVRGFDEFFGFLTGGHNYFPDQLTLQDLSEVKKPWDWYRTKLLRGEERVTTTEYLTDELSNAAVDFIHRSHDKPFFLYLAYNAPHEPLQATEKYLSRFRSIEDPKRRTYAAMVSAVDDGVGNVLQALSDHQLDRQTIVFFLSDNGGPSTNGSSNGPLRDYKGSPFEGGVRVPYAVRWVGTLPEGVDYNAPVSSMDIAATIVAHSGAEVRSNKPLDGVDLIPYLKGDTASLPHAALFWRWYDNQRCAVRVGNRKLIMMAEAADQQEFNPPLYYDLHQDLGETNNRFNREGAQVDEAAQLLYRWKQELVPPLAPGLGSWPP
ncbi:sulfatase-like hydrolase/transferase [Botrimarina hoheduenensis]|nr:sulfatase-like hydrolase/transferase [Botrimarina hoheduenensis]